MKILTILSALQIVAITFLVLAVRHRDRAEYPASAPVIAPAATVTPAGVAPGEEQLRRIVRAELAAWHAAGSDRRIDVSAAPRTGSAVDQRAQLELVAQQLEQYRSQGYMSPIEMGNFQAEIAQLDPAARKQMLSNLVRAMNSGEIRGQF